ncbi:MAG: hypothetical protein GF313_00325 [Caldithrix sp.]|nr:hypothetical protein [Caldithrix sp.]
MNSTKRSILDVRSLIGIFIVIAGVILLLDNFGYDLNIDIWEWWPVILIIIGVSQLSGNPRSAGGWILVALGAVLLFNNLDLLNFRFRHIWPVILILIGLALLKHGFFSQKKLPASEDSINLTFVLGGGHHKYTSQTLRGGNVTAILGGGKVDLRQASLHENRATLDTFTIWGGIEIVVPKNWHVQLNASPILGGIDNNTSFVDDRPDEQKNEPVNTLEITGMAIMGGIEIKNE